MKSGMARVSAALRLVIGMMLCGVAAFYWSVEVQSAVAPYHPFSQTAAVVYAVIICAALLLGTWASGASHRMATWTSIINIGLRYFLAFQMVKYGLAKIIPVQFTPSLYWNDLTGQYLSAFDRAWMFFSYSRVYGLFLGGFEVMAGLLLVARRSVLVGALATFAIMINITIVDVEFDVPIVWDAVVFTSMSIYLIGCRSDRLLALLLDRHEVASPRWYGVAATAVALVFIGYHGLDHYRTRYGGGWFSPVYGAWVVVEAVDDSGRRVEPRVLGFDRMYFEEGRYFHLRSLDGRVTDLWTSFQIEGDRMQTQHPALQFSGQFRITDDRLVLNGSESTRRLTSIVLQRAP